MGLEFWAMSDESMSDGSIRDEAMKQMELMVIKGWMSGGMIDER
jgi:hypothetical protein